MNNLKITILLIISILMLSAVVVPVGESANGEREFRLVHINLKAEDGLSPEFEHENDTEPQTKRVRAQYDEYPGTRTNREWVDAGTWTSDGVAGAMTIDSGTFTFNLWFQVVASDYSAEPDWEFKFFHNGVEICTVTVTNAEESSDHPVEVRANANIGTPDIRSMMATAPPHMTKGISAEMYI